LIAEFYLVDRGFYLVDRGLRHRLITAGMTLVHVINPLHRNRSSRNLVPRWLQLPKICGEEKRKSEGTVRPFCGSTKSPTRFVLPQKGRTKGKLISENRTLYGAMEQFIFTPPSSERSMEQFIESRLFSCLESMTQE
jgi:hypothetical protein